MNAGVLRLPMSKYLFQPLEREDNIDFYSFAFFYTTSDSTIKAGMNNTIVVPSSIFTNSYFYQHEIVDGNGKDTWANLTFYANDSSADSTTAHVSGVIYGNITGDNFSSLLTELSENTTGAVTYNYTTDDPYQINLPGDVLKLVPFSQYARGSKGSNSNLCVLIENSPTQKLKGTSSKGIHNSVNGWGDFLKGIVNAAIEVGTVAWDFASMAAQSAKNIICSAITAVLTTAAEFIIQLGKAIINFGMKVIGAFDMMLSEIGDVLKKMGDILTSMLEWIKESLENTLFPIAALVGNSIYNYILDKSNEKPQARSVSEAKIILERESLSLEGDAEGLFKDFRNALFDAFNFVSSFSSLIGIEKIFASVLGDSIKLMFAPFGEVSSTISEDEAKSMWDFMNDNVDVTSVDSYRRFFLNYAEDMLDENTGGSKSLTKSVAYHLTRAGDSEHKFALVVGEYNSAIENSVKHDVDELYKLLPSKGYTMITVKGHYENLQLDYNEIKKAFGFLAENLTQHPDAKVFVAFLGHGWTDGQKGAYVLHDGSVYYWSQMATDFDNAILDKDGDNSLSVSELNNPPYSTLIMVFQTCHSRYAIDEFAVRDFPKKRILISATDYGEEAWSIESVTPGTIFMHHFTDNLQGDYSEAFIFTFVQVTWGFFSYMFPWLVIGLLTGGWIGYGLLMTLENPYIFEIIIGLILGILLTGCMFGRLAAYEAILNKYI